MNVFITGGAGFIGSNLAENLLAAGHHVQVLDNLSTGRKENLDTILSHPGFQFHLGTVTDATLVEPLVAWADHVYHLAAPVGVKYIMDNPVLTILDNVRGMDVVIAAVHKHNKRMLVASTSEVYGRSLDLLDPTGQRKLKEDDYRVEGTTTNHRWAYANTKSMDEFLALAYWKQYGTRSVIVRFFNTVGPRQLSLYGMVIPNFVKAALSGEDLVIFGDGTQKRSFLHVNDALRAITGLMGSDAALGQVFNVGNPFEITIRELAERVIALTGSTSGIRCISYEEAYGKGFEDMNRRTADISKLRNALGFELGYDLDALLTDIIAYHRQAV
ncbi:MAG: GDP-mannose 4,6-dehydratase [Bacteroidetes bacterium]|nr:GDP-mannose 4,6-dehydratase [Bacteroidota bacterium]